MTSDFPLSGHVAPGYEPLRDRLAQMLELGDEAGCQLAITRNGVTVVDLVAGWRDREGTTPLTAETLIPVYSVTKAICALIIATLVDEERLDYGAPVSSIWPAFASAGKDAITVEQILSHQAGLPGFVDDWQAVDWYDWEKTTARLASMAPLWAPGSQSGYHPITWGYLAGEVVRRAAGSTLGALLRDRLAAPHGLDVWIGLPDEHHHRAATPRKSPRPPHLGELNDVTKIAFLKPWSSPRHHRDEHAWMRHEVPAANGYATALGLARLFQPFARSGMLDATAILQSHSVQRVTKQRIQGQDLILPFDLSWGAGLIRNTPSPQRHYYGPSDRAVGHTGFGGSCLFADPASRLTFAYATLTHSPALVTDTRATALIETVYEVVDEGAQV